MKKEIICTGCPRGCHITVEGEGDAILSVEGFACKRGDTYARAEFAHPVRILTTTVKMAGAKNALVEKFEHVLYGKARMPGAVFQQQLLGHRHLLFSGISDDGMIPSAGCGGK